MQASKAFDFGKNWASFISRYLTTNRIEKAKHSLQNFLGIKTLEGRSFLDIGCGSGLFSLAALELGASRVTSFDVDPFSVECCRELHRRKSEPSHWVVQSGSILDKSFTRDLQPADIVYSWGVLHHTGSMWNAIEAAASLVKTGGLFYLAIYNKADGWGIHPDGRMGPSSFWLWEKRIYARLPLFLQNVIDYAVMTVMVLSYLLTVRNPIRVIHRHTDDHRGMSWRIDIKDWLGGFPYECARADEIFHFLKSRGFVLENLTCNNGLLNNEFLFRRISSSAL